MQIFLLGALAVSLIAVLFALQNIVPVTVAFLGWTFQGSLALVLFVAFVGGALASFLASIPSMVTSSRSRSQDRKTIAALQTSLAECQRSMADAQRRGPAISPRQGPSSSATP